MSPLKIATMQDKLIRLAHNIDFIEDILKKPDYEIIKDMPLFYGLEHMLQISIEIILDIGNHILVEQFKQSPKDYSDTIVLLGKNGIVDNDFAALHVAMAGFRNLLVHEYDFIKEDKVLEYARKAPGVFRQFGKNFSDFLEKNKV